MVKNILSFALKIVFIYFIIIVLSGLIGAFSYWREGKNAAQQAAVSCDTISCEARPFVCTRYSKDASPENYYCSSGDFFGEMTGAALIMIVFVLDALFFYSSSLSLFSGDAWLFILNYVALLVAGIYFYKKNRIESNRSRR